MLMIRLQRIGRKNIATFRIVLTESQNSAKSGRYAEILGSYDPVHKVKEVNAERVKYWMGKGAQLSDTMRNFLIEKKSIDGKKLNVLPRKSKTLKRKELKAAAGKKSETPTAPTATAPAQILPAAPVAPATPKPAETAPVAEKVTP